MHGSLQHLHTNCTIFTPTPCALTRFRRGREKPMPTRCSRSSNTAPASLRQSSWGPVSAHAVGSERMLGLYVKQQYQVGSTVEHLTDPWRDIQRWVHVEHAA